MRTVRIPLCLLALAALAVAVFGDDPPKKPDTAPAAKHSLPQGWKALGLSDAQKKAVYVIEDEYEPKLTALKKQIETLQNEEKAKKYDVLTAEQKKALAAIRESKDGGKSEKKP